MRRTTLINNLCEKELDPWILNWNHIKSKFHCGITSDSWMSLLILLKVFSDSINLFFALLTLSWWRPLSYKTSPLTCSANQWTSFYMITAPVMKELMEQSWLEKISTCFVITQKKHFLLRISSVNLTGHIYWRNP